MTLISKCCHVNGNSWLMFGSQAISENSIATDGVVLLGSQTLDANFTQSTNLSGTFLGSMTVDAFSPSLQQRQGYLSLKLIFLQTSLKPQMVCVLR